MTVFADTFALIAWLNPRDTDHSARAAGRFCAGRQLVLSNTCNHNNGHGQEAAF